MDQLEIRPLKFDFESVAHQEPVWSYTNPLFAIFINGLAVHSPYFERYLVKVCREARKRIRDPRLVRDLATLIGQEAHHANNFIGMNGLLAKRYPQVVRFEQEARAYFEDAFAHHSLKKQLAFVAGYETFTYLAGMIVLDRYEEFMADADPTIRALWVWHQVEEVEHGAVAFDAYRALFGASEWYRKLYLLKAFAYVSAEAARGYAHMCEVEGHWSTPSKAWRAAKFFSNLSLELARRAAPALLRSYHPRNHPLCRERQNPIAVAWRQAYARGEDALSLDRTRMEALIGAP